MSPTHHLQQGTLGLSRCYTPLKKQRISRSGPLSQQRQQQVLTADIGMPCLLRRPLGALQCRGRPRCKAIVLIHRVSPPFCSALNIGCIQSLKRRTKISPRHKMG